MRRLTIQSFKGFGSAGKKMPVYIEDQAYGDVLINDVPCQKLGEIGNGETASFYIANDALKVFVAPGKKGLCDYYPIPEGDEDLFLSGKTQFNPVAGNPFLFDGVEEEALLEQRKKDQKNGLIVLGAGLVLCFALIVGIVLLAVGLGRGGGEEFSADGLTIEMDEEFEQIPGTGFALCCEGPEAVMFALKEEFSLMEGLESYTVEEYAQTVFQNNPMAADSSLQTKGDLNWFEYSYQNLGEEEPYHFYVYIFKSNDAFWMVQFAAPEGTAEDAEAKIEKWAGSVRFAEAEEGSF